MTLIGWWPLHENNGQANDLSGNGNHGTLNGGIIQGVAGKQGLTAYSFDGSDDYISLGSNIFSLSEYTISLWVKHDSIDSSRHVYIGLEGVVNVRQEGDGNGILYYHEDGSNNSLRAPAPNVDQWTHIAIQYDGKNTVQLWVDGQREDVSQGVNDAIFGSKSRGNKIGALYDGSDLHNGEICDVRIYNRPLSPQEIQTLYKWGSGDYTDGTLHDGTDSGAVSRWTFDDTVNDSWGSNDGGSSTSSGYTSNSIRGKAMQFNGTDDNITFPSLGTFSQYTISAWVQFNNPNDGDDDAMLTLRSDNEVLLRNNGAGTFEFIQIDSDNNGNTLLATIDNSGWHHVTCIWDGSNMKLYKNGAFIESGAMTSTNVPNKTNVIGSSEANTRYMDGKIDDVRIYNRALSPSEIFQLYQWGTKGRDMRKKIINARGNQ